MMRLGRADLIQSNLQAGVGYWVVSRGSRGGGCPSLHGKVLLTTSELRLGASDLLLCPVPSLRDLPGPRVPDAQGEGLRLDQPKGVCVRVFIHTCAQYSPSPDLQVWVLCSPFCVQG